MTDVTQILGRIENGDPSAAEQLLPLVYQELRKLAAARMSAERSDHTLQPTALVHEAYVRLVDADKAQKWNSRGHFFGAAAEAMRRILVESARRKQGQKLGGNRKKFSLDEADLAASVDAERILAVDDALHRLADDDPQVAELVKLRVFAGMTVDQAAAAIGVSRTTAFRYWTYARAWLRAEFVDEE